MNRKDWASNMKQKNGEEYEESTLKTISNDTTKMFMDEYFQKYEIQYDQKCQGRKNL